MMYHNIIYLKNYDILNDVLNDILNDAINWYTLMIYSTSSPLLVRNFSAQLKSDQ